MPPWTKMLGDRTIGGEKSFEHAVPTAPAGLVKYQHDKWFFSFLVDEGRRYHVLIRYEQRGVGLRVSVNDDRATGAILGDYQWDCYYSLSKDVSKVL